MTEDLKSAPDSQPVLSVQDLHVTFGSGAAAVAAVKGGCRSRSIAAKLWRWLGKVGLASRSRLSRRCNFCRNPHTSPAVGLWFAGRLLSGLLKTSCGTSAAIALGLSFKSR